MLELNCSYKNIIDDLIAFNRHELLNYFLENYGNENEEKAIQNKLEKFVDENPDAVASLLRNWINEDWG